MALAAGLLAGGAALTPAAAADLGGNCCADLEERIAELEATSARKGNRKVSLTVSGQVTTSVMAWNDDNDTHGSDTYVVDNVMGGGSFFSFTGSARVNPNLTAGFQVVVALDTGGRSHQVSQLDDDGTSTQAGSRGTGGFDTDIVITLANWYLDHKQIGRVTVGRINTSTAGLTTIDLGGAGVIANASIGYTQRGMFLALDDNLQDGTWAAALGGNTVNGASLSRANAVRYDTPTFGGFSLSVSAGEDDVWDAALRYAGEFSGFRVAAGVGFIHNSAGTGDVTDRSGTTSPFPDGTEPDVWKGSASILHVKSGIYLTSAYVNQDNDVAGRPDTTLWYVQGGIGQNWTGIGKTVFYTEYARVNDGIICGAGECQDFGGAAGDVIDSSEASMWGIGVVQHIDSAAMEVFLAYKRFSAEVTSPAGNKLNGTESYNDFDVVVGGARIRF
jgi:hypothetical protein